MPKRNRPTDRWTGDPVEILWGVKRRNGFGAIDDPRAHRGRVQHAYVAGYDDLALCGHRTNRWFTGQGVQLAMPTELNPQCPRCHAAVSEQPSVQARPVPLPVLVLAPVPSALSRAEAPWPQADLRDSVARTASTRPVTERPVSGAVSRRKLRRRRSVAEAFVRTSAGVVGKAVTTFAASSSPKRSKAKT